MNERNRVFNNLFWRFAERCGAQIVQTIVSIVLARVLEPEIFGTIALVIVFAKPVLGTIRPHLKKLNTLSNTPKPVNIEPIIINIINVIKYASL